MKTIGINLDREDVGSDAFQKMLTVLGRADPALVVLMHKNPKDHFGDLKGNVAYRWLSQGHSVMLVSHPEEAPELVQWVSANPQSPAP